MRSLHIGLALFDEADLTCAELCRATSRSPTIDCLHTRYAIAKW
jgi:hypothetical protein